MINVDSYMRIFDAILLALLFLSGCENPGRMSAAFESIDALCDTDPQTAILMLDSISDSDFSEAERHRFDLLTIKARDKAYMTHTSDSLILDVIDYYSRHKSSPVYPEALYYGGRVYSDLGDFPTALSFFQSALEVIPDDLKYLRLKSVLLSQTGRLLMELRLYSDAVGYFKSSIEIEKQLKESVVDQTYNNILIAENYIALERNADAQRHIMIVDSLMPFLPDEERANAKVVMAEMMFSEGRIGEALNIVRNLPDEVDSICHNYAVAIASQIYQYSGKPDTAYMYAKELIRSNNPLDCKTGYKVIFSNELSDFIDKESLLSYINDYKSTIEDYLDSHEAQEVLLQHVKYNYDTHLRERNKSDQKSLLYQKILLIVFIVCFVFILIIGYQRYRNALLLMKFYKSLSLLRQIRSDALHAVKGKDNGEIINVENNAENNNEESAEQTISECERIRERLNKSISSAPSDTSDRIVPREIRESEIYDILRRKISQDEMIFNREDYWIDLESIFSKVYPDFKNILVEVSGGKISDNEFRVAMALRCGFTPSQISTLMGCGTNNVSYYRKNLVEKLTGKKLSSRFLDQLIAAI